MQRISLSQKLWWLAAAMLAVGQSPAAVSASEAEQIFRQNCAVCHGDKGDGQSRARFGLNPPPRDFTSPQAAAELTRARMIASVTHGRKGTAMVGWQGRLSQNQIEGVVDFIRATFMVAVAPAPAVVAEAAPPVQPPATAAISAPQGQRIFEEHCRVCHGDKGNGSTWTYSVLNPPPRNFTAPQSRRILTRARMIASVTHGRKGTAMMSFSGRLSEQEIASVVDYIRGGFMQGEVIPDAGSEGAALPGQSPHEQSAHGQAPGSVGSAGMAPNFSADVAKADMSLPMPYGLKGNFERGREFFMNNCATCHGQRGDGTGPRAGFIVPPPRNFLNPDSQSTLNRPALFKAVVIGKAGTPMPAWGKVLGPQQIADVVEFVFQDFISQGKNAAKKKAR
ncbi:MAG: c-type cytochrome [Gammaproteobacteria bacterium]|nr:c-type cytochrome [Gammaproteobacteria bacterium]